MHNMERFYEVLQDVEQKRLQPSQNQQNIPAFTPPNRLTAAVRLRRQSLSFCNMPPLQHAWGILHSTPCVI